MRESPPLSPLCYQVICVCVCVRLCVSLCVCVHAAGELRFYRTRLDSILQREQIVDPEEHRVAVEKLAAREAELTAAREAAEAAKAEKEALAAEVARLTPLLEAKTAEAKAATAEAEAQSARASKFRDAVNNLRKEKAEAEVCLPFPSVCLDPSLTIVCSPSPHPPGP